MLADLLLIAASGGAAFLGASLGRRVRFFVPLLPARELEADHHHRFDTMRADGQGWRCGECDMPQSEVM